MTGSEDDNFMRLLTGLNNFQNTEYWDLSQNRNRNISSSHVIPTLVLA